MTRQPFSVLLILIMVVTPIASAFGHCSGMAMRGHIPESKNLTVAVLIDRVASLKHQNIDQERHNDQVDMDCHALSNCAFHVCGDYSIIASAATVDTATSICYSGSEHFLPYSTDLSPDLRPPILNRG